MATMTAVEIKQMHLGVMQAFFQDFETHRLPRILQLKDKVDRGETINDVEFEYLCKEINDACTVKHLTINYPELEEFCLEVGHLYKELCDKAVENEMR